MSEMTKQEKLKELNEQLIQAKAYRDHLNDTVYSNNDWNSAPEGEVRRLEIAIKAVEAGAETVDLNCHHGVLINNWLIIALNKKKWSYLCKTWFWYSDLDELLAKHVTMKRTNKEE